MSSILRCGLRKLRALDSVLILYFLQYQKLILHVRRFIAIRYCFLLHTKPALKFLKVKTSHKCRHPMNMKALKSEPSAQYYVSVLVLESLEMK